MYKYIKSTKNIIFNFIIFFFKILVQTSLSRNCNKKISSKLSKCQHFLIKLNMYKKCLMKFHIKSIRKFLFFDPMLRNIIIDY